MRAVLLLLFIVLLLVLLVKACSQDECTYSDRQEGMSYDRDIIRLPIRRRPQ